MPHAFSSSCFCSCFLFLLSFVLPHFCMSNLFLSQGLPQMLLWWEDSPDCPSWQCTPVVLNLFEYFLYGSYHFLHGMMIMSKYVSYFLCPVNSWRTELELVFWWTICWCQIRKICNERYWLKSKIVMIAYNIIMN